jgi:hypothetical protein
MTKREWNFVDKFFNENEVQTYPKVNVETEKEAWKGSKNLDKSSIFH